MIWRPELGTGVNTDGTATTNNFERRKTCTKITCWTDTRRIYDEEEEPPTFMSNPWNVAAHLRHDISEVSCVFTQRRALRVSHLVVHCAFSCTQCFFHSSAVLLLSRAVSCSHSLSCRETRWMLHNLPTTTATVLDAPHSYLVCRFTVETVTHKHPSQIKDTNTGKRCDRMRKDHSAAKKEKKKKGESYRFAIILNVNAAKLKIYPDYAQNIN